VTGTNTASHDIQAAARSMLTGWLDRAAPAGGREWLDEVVERISEGAPDRYFFTRFSLAQRRLGKADLALEAVDHAEAQELRAGWDPTGLTCDQAARTVIALALPSDDAQAWLASLDRLYAAADVGELVVLYRCLPLMPRSKLLAARCSEGVRTNIRAVFEAVAHRSPFPAEQLDEGAWNQMVLKSIFVGSELRLIQRLDERANERLAGMLRDFAHERWAAGREVPLDLWRCVGPYADDEAINDLARVLSQGSEGERRAAALALSTAPSPRAYELLESIPDLVALMDEDELTWETVDMEAS
jgi:hypothetical protein